MSRSTPVCQLKCSKCQAKATFAQRFGNAFDVAVYGRYGDYALCRCKTRGHEYKSNSRAAKHRLWQMDKFGKCP